VEVHGKTLDVVMAVITILSSVIENQESTDDKLVILQELNHWTTNEAFGMKEQYEKGTDCSGPIRVHDVSPELAKTLEAIFKKKFNGENQND
jgi:hypothetical protein